MTSVVLEIDGLGGAPVKQTVSEQVDFSYFLVIIKCFLVGIENIVVRSFITELLTIILLFIIFYKLYIAMKNEKFIIQSIQK